MLIVKKLIYRDFEYLRKHTNIRKRNISLPAFDHSYIGSVEAGEFR